MHLEANARDFSQLERRRQLLIERRRTLLGEQGDGGAQPSLDLVLLEEREHQYCEDVKDAIRAERVWRLDSREREIRLLKSVGRCLADSKVPDARRLGENLLLEAEVRKSLVGEDEQMLERKLGELEASLEGFCGGT
jgi:hypothetical protein